MLTCICASSCVCLHRDRGWLPTADVHRGICDRKPVRKELANMEKEYIYIFHWVGICWAQIGGDRKDDLKPFFIGYNKVQSDFLKHSLLKRVSVSISELAQVLQLWHVPRANNLDQLSP